MKRLLAILLSCCLAWPVAQAWEEPAPLVRNDSIESSPAYLFHEALQSLFCEGTPVAYEQFKACLRLDSTMAEAWFRLTPYYLESGQTDSALICLENALSYDPDNKYYVFGLSSVYLDAGRFVEAAHKLEDYVAKHPKEYEYYFSIASIYAQADAPQDAIRVLRQLEKIDGKSRDISLEIFKQYRKMGYKKLALNEIQSLLDTEPENYQYRLLLAYANEDYKEKTAIKLYRQLMEDGQGNGEADFLLANYLIRLERNSEAEDIYRQLFDSPKGSFANKTEVLYKYYLQHYPNDTTLIQGLIEKLVKQYPQEPQAYSLYAKWQAALGNSVLAASYYRRSLDMDPSQYTTWMEYLNIFLEYNNTTMVKNICEEARIYFPRESNFPYYIAICHNIDGETDAALNAFRECLNVLATTQERGQNELMSQVLGDMGDLFHIKGEMDSCYYYYELALAKNAENAAVLNNYAYFLSLEKRDLDRAEAMARTAVKLDDDNATYLDTYAWVCFKQGQYTMAKLYIEQAFSHGMEPSAELLEHYGDILWFCHDRDAAIERWKQAIQLSRTPSDALIQKTVQGQYVE